MNELERTMNKRYLTALTLGGMAFFAACGTDSPQTTDETFFEDTATVAPVTPAPTTTTDPAFGPADPTMDPTLQGTPGTDPATPGATTPGAADQQPGTTTY
jgi:hypothetical protein